MAVVITVISIVVSLLEGINMSLLVPLLENLESGDQGGGHWVSSAFARIFDLMGLPFGLISMLIALAVVVLAVVALKYLSLILSVRTNVGFGVWLRSKLMGNYLHSDASYFHHEEVGKLTNTLTTQVDQGQSVMSTIINMVSIIGLTGAYLAVALMISPLLTGVALGILLVLTLAMQFFIARARKLGVRLVQAQGELQSAAMESLSGVRVIKAFLLEPFRQTHFAAKATETGRVIYGINRNTGQSQIVGELALFIIIGGIVYIAVAFVELDLTVIVALLFVLYRLSPKVNLFNSHRQSLALSMASLHHIKTTLDETAAPTIVTGHKQFERFRSGVALTNVCFSYDGGPSVLDDASIYIEKGKMTALVGTSGAGKSTLIDLLLRFYDPVKGSLLVDGTDLRELDLASWRRSVSVVSQDIFLFNDTIANNILLWKLDSNWEDVVDAAKQAYAHDFIQQLSDGYDTVVGDRGLNLSGGQRQRIALARAVLRKPEFLILDEATSSLDSESEAVIQKYIDEIRGTCTIMVVAHRMSTIKDADRIAVLEHGKIVEEGDWDSLLAAEGVFARYHHLQFRS